MAVKTITITLEAYSLLAREKRAGQSFSQVITEHFAPQPDVAGFRHLLRGVHLNPDALEAMDRQVQARRGSPARAARR